MAKIIYALAAIFLCTVCKAQFFYNEDQQQQPLFQDWNTPTVGQGTPVQQSEPVSHQPAQQAPPAASPEYEQRPPPNRGSRRRSAHREPQIVQLQPPARVYSPSVFENLALGMPPAGVSIPSDSFLNVLRNDGRNTPTRPNPVYQPPPPQRTTFVQSPPAQNFPAPLTESVPYSNQPAGPPQRIHRVESPAERHIERSQPQPVHNSEQYQAPQAPVQVPVQPIPQRTSRRQSGSRHRQTSSEPPWRLPYVEPEQPPRVYSPSVFQNLALGVAPTGISVPEDSLLNLLRSDRPIRSRRNQAYQTAPQVAPAEPIQYSDEHHSPIQSHSQDFESSQEIQNVQPAPRRVSYQPPQEIQNVQPVPRRVYRPPPQEVQNVQPVPRRVDRPPPQPRPQPEVVENVPDYQDIEEQQQAVRKPVQNRRRVTIRRHRQSSGSLPRSDLNEDEEIYQPPKQFAPSVFEKIGLGEAPPGIHVPEDSFLNLLRGDRPVSRPAQQPVNQRSHIPQQAAPLQSEQHISPAQDPTVSDYNEQYDSYSRQSRRSRPSIINQPPQQRQQHIPRQEYQPPANIQPEREYRRPVSQEIPQPVVVSRPIPQPKRQRQRSQPVRAPQPQPAVVYNAGPDVQEVDDIQRYRGQDNNQRTRHQARAPEPQPVYEAPQPNYHEDTGFEEDDIPRRRPHPANQRREQVQQPVQRQRTESRPPQPQRARNEQASGTREQSRHKAAKLSVKPLPDDVDGDQIPGEAGIDYPTLHVIPKTSFSCARQPHNGYYADLDTSCQVVHMCQAGGVQSSFLCPNGTIFNQVKFSCEWWYKVNCADSPSHYGINDKLYKVPSK